MSSIFIGVYKALYDYQAQNEEELDLSENDLLYLLEKSEVDDWWKVKKRVVGSDAEEPQGLVPSNYIEPAPVQSSAVALYDYDKQTEEEITFTEGSRFDVYDTSDADWILVGLNGQQFGFVPANYIEVQSGTPAPAPVAAPAALPVSAFPPPPQRVDSTPAPAAPQFEDKDLPPIKPARPEYTEQEYHYDEPAEEEAPPPKPMRPSNNSTPNRTRATSSASRYSEDVGHSNPDEFVKDDFFTWPCQEINGRKKKKCTLGIGNASIYISPESGGYPQQWDITNLVNFNLEGKRVFLDFKQPKESYELHTGSKDSAGAICSILGDLKGAASMNGLKEVKEATITGERKTGKILYDFQSDSPDELTVFEGETVIIINDKKSKDWWMVESVNTGERGVVPSNFIKIASSGGSTLGNFFRRRSSSQSLLSPSKKHGKKKDRAKEREREYEREEYEAEQRARQKRKEREMRDREQRDKIRQRDEREREKASSSSKKSGDKSKPNPHRVRTWIDRSGSFKVEAEFLGCTDGKIHLHKLNGVKIAVAAPKLSSEDLEYVERITGMSLESYKPRPEPTPRPSYSQPEPQQPAKSVMQVAEPAAPKLSPAKDPDYDWFEFFLNCGVEVNNCQRYTINFNKEQMDENILEDISPSLLRTLGLREGDILRVMKYLDNKFNRKRDQPLESTTTGGLFSGADGALKTNRTGSVAESGVNGAVLNNGAAQKFEDDAWAVKPAAKTESVPQQPARPPSVPTQQLTGSLQDLVNIRPVESKSATPAPAPAPAASIQPLQPNKTSSAQPLQPQKTQATGGFIPMQPTGFVPIGLMPTMTGMTLQPTGLMPFQKTGTFVPLQPTGLVPLQKTGGFGAMPATSFGMVPLQKTGGLLPLQPTGLVPLQKTGGLVPAQPTGFMPQTSFGMQLQKTGGFATQPTGFSAMPQTSFGALPLQKTGGFVPSQPTGFMPQTSFGVQKTGGFQPTSSFGVMLAQKTGGLQQPMATGFQQQPMPQTSFGNPMMPTQKTGGFSAQMPQTSFGGMNGMPTGFNGMPTGQFQQQQQQPQFAQNFMQQQTGMNNLTNMFQNTSLNGFQQQSQPQQMPFNTFNTGFDQSFQQPLQSQPTGLGFGNAPSTSFGQPLQSQPTGRRANLAAATADNPFGF